VLATEGVKLSNIEGSNKTEGLMDEKPKHLRAQAAMDVQSSIVDLSHGFASGGQHSDMSPSALISVEWNIALVSGEVFAGTATLPAIGSIATESARTSVDMVRANRMGIMCSAISNVTRKGVK